MVNVSNLVINTDLSNNIENFGTFIFKFISSTFVFYVIVIVEMIDIKSRLKTTTITNY